MLTKWKIAAIRTAAAAKMAMTFFADISMTSLIKLAPLGAPGQVGIGLALGRGAAGNSSTDSMTEIENSLFSHMNAPKPPVV